MSLHRRMDGSDAVRSEAAAQPVEVREDRRLASSWRLGTGTLACASCDAPVALAAERMAPGDSLRCPYCGREGAVREFLSLVGPSRPARVEVRVVHRGRRALR